MQSETNIALLVAVGSLAMFFLAAMIVLFVVVYQRKMLEKEARIKYIEQEKQIQLFKATVEAEEMQKEKIANNLHDSVNPLLALVKMNLTKHKMDIEKNKFNMESLKEDAKIIDQAAEGIRASCRDLIPSFLLEFGLNKTLEDYIRNLNNSETKKGTFVNLTPEIKTPFLNKQDQLASYRICMEILNNLFKHAGYTEIRIEVSNSPQYFSMQVFHNGKGITNEEINAITETSKGQGLRSLKTRIMLLNAKIDYVKHSTESYIRFEVPILNPIKN